MYSLSSPQQNYEETNYKVVVIGDEKVGKTSLIRRYVEGKFEESYKNTIGVDIFTKRLYSNGKKATLVIWDFGGQKVFEHLRKNFYVSAQAVILAYDITNRKSFTGLDDWINECDENVGRKNPIILIGTKIDLKDEKVIENEEAIRYAKNKNIDFIETSSKWEDESGKIKGYNLNFAFQRLTHLCMSYAIDGRRLTTNRKFVKEYQKILETELKPLMRGEYHLCDISKTRICV